jgi:hypothetical protein
MLYQQWIQVLLQHGKGELSPFWQVYIYHVRETKANNILPKIQKDFEMKAQQSKTFEPSSEPFGQIGETTFPKTQIQSLTVMTGKPGIPGFQAPFHLLFQLKQA